MFTAEMLRVGGRVAERGVDLVTQQRLSSVQHQYITDLQTVQSQLTSLHGRLDDVSSKHAASSTALLELSVSRFHTSV